MMRVIPIVLACALLTGCQTLSFYQQAVTGQVRLLLARESVGDLLTSSPDPALRERLQLVGEILDFARAGGLETGGAFESYVETGGPYVVWNVFASRPFELALKTHCFPVAGCVSYRGYFREQDARRYAASLEARGYEVFVGGVAAYSTLGWFDDPLLDTFLFRQRDQLAALVFHELAHQLVYVPGDTRFNESVATAVEQYLLQKWLAERGEIYLFRLYIASQARRQAVLQLIEKARASLKVLYASDISRETMAREKQAVYERLRADYATLSASWTTGSEFRSWMDGDMNNAKLETVADYNQWVPSLTVLLNELGIDGFRQRANELAGLARADRERVLGQVTAAGQSSR